MARPCRFANSVRRAAAYARALESRLGEHGRAGTKRHVAAVHYGVSGAKAGARARVRQGRIEHASTCTCEDAESEGWVYRAYRRRRGRTQRTARGPRTAVDSWQWTDEQGRLRIAAVQVAHRGRPQGAPMPPTQRARAERNFLALCPHRTSGVPASRQPQLLPRPPQRGATSLRDPSASAMRRPLRHKPVGATRASPNAMDTASQVGEAYEPCLVHPSSSSAVQRALGQRSIMPVLQSVSFTFANIDHPRATATSCRRPARPFAP